MQAAEHYLDSKDGHQIFVKHWQPSDDVPIRAAIHINHGMAEHCLRYQPLAEKLTAEGYVVFAHDHRGHGHSIPPGGLVGHYADVNGWNLVLADVHRVNAHIQDAYPDLPIILFGHSMGSFISQCYSIKHGDTVDAVVLSGSGFSAPAALRAPKMLVRLEKFRSGPKSRSKLIDRQTFTNFNKRFGKTRTSADWLSRDMEQVDKYVNDPLCGFLCTNQLWEDFLKGLETLSKEKNLRRIPSHVPFYLVSGERDPLSYHSRKHGIDQLAKHLRSGGLKDVSVKIYEDARHEIFNEINRDEVTSDLLSWLDSKQDKLLKLKKPEAAMA